MKKLRHVLFAAALLTMPLAALATLVQPLMIKGAIEATLVAQSADALMAVIETLEPPPDLAEAVQDIVRAVMLMADVTRPRRLPQPAAAGRPSRRPASRRHPR